MKRVVLLLCVIVIVASCSKKVGFEKHLPADTTVMMAVDVKSMMKKVVWEVLFSPEKLEKLFQKNQDASKVFQDPKSTGIDLFSRLYFFQTSTSKENELLGLMKLQDFEAFNELMKSQHAKVEELQGSTYYQIDYTHFLTNKDIVVFVLSQEKEVKDVLMQILNNENDVFALKGMKDVLLSEHDFLMWSDFSQFMAPKLGRLNMSEENTKSIENDVLTGFADFNDGSIDVVVDYESNGDSQKMKDRFFTKNAFGNMLKNSGNQSVYGLSTVALNFEEISKYLAENGWLDKYNSGFFRLYQTSPEQILAMLDGEVMLYYTGAEKKQQLKQDLVYDFDKEETVFVTDTVEVMNYNSVLAIGVKELEQMQQLVNKFGMMLNQYPGGYYGMKGENVFIALNNQILYISNDEKSIQSVMESKEMRLPSNVKKVIPDSPFSVWLDIESSARDISEHGVLPEKELSKVQQYLKEILFYGKRDGNHFQQNLNLKFKNESQNSLIQLMEMMGEVAEEPAA